MSGYETISVQSSDKVWTVTLQRPERRNALTSVMVVELNVAFESFAADEVARVMILTGEGEAFCSGLDLDELQKMATQDDATQRINSDRIATMLRTLYDCPKPTIAAVRGPAVAGGMGLATICDFTLASADAKFGYPEVKIGFIPAIVSAFLVRQVGEKQARDLLLSGRLLDAREGHALGLVTRVTQEGENVQEAAQQLAELLLKNSPASLIATKRLLREQSTAQLDRDLKAAAEANAAMRKTRDFAEGLSAFLEKRKPAWF